MHGLLPCLRQVWPELWPIDERVAIFANCSHHCKRQQGWKHDVLTEADKRTAFMPPL